MNQFWVNFVLILYFNFSVVTSVSVILNGEEPPKFSDAVGKPVPRPLVPPQVASPINLLNPDRYEFYTFNDSGDLIRRLMTMKEIQSIVAGGSNEGSMMHHSSSDDQNLDDNVEDIVTSVQKVLNEEVEANKNTSNQHNVLDTPDVSSTWSIILPAIFGNTGDDIRPHKPQIAMTPDAVIVDATEKTTANKVGVKVKPSNSASLNKIDEPAEKKTSEKPTITEEPIVHITKKKPIISAFEASTPRSNIGGYQEHTIDEIQLNHNNSLFGYRRKTTAVPDVSTTENIVKTSKPTPSRFVTRRRPTPDTHRIEVTTTVATSTPQFEEVTFLHSTKTPSTESGIEEITDAATESATEEATELVTEAAPISVLSTTVADLIENITTAPTDSNRLPELTTYYHHYVETTIPEEESENSNVATTTENEDVSVENVGTTQFSGVFDSSNSLSQIIESLKDDLVSETESEIVEKTTQNNEIVSTTDFGELTTIDSTNVEESGGHTTERDMVKIPSIDITQRINQSNTYANEEMFVDEQEPLVYDIPTTTDFSVDTTEYNEEATFKDEDLALPVFQEIKLQYPESSSIFEEKNPIVQQVDNFIHDNPAEIPDSLAVESVNNENKVANVVSLENLSQSEFIGQAATVASILSNDADNIPLKEIVNQLVLSPQLRNDEPKVHPTTNLPAKFNEMEVMSLQKEKTANTEDVSYETSVIKETSSISMSSNQPVELNKNSDESTKKLIKNQLSAELFSLEPDASTEISVESDVHEVLNMVKLKMPSNAVKLSAIVTSPKDSPIIDEITTIPTVTDVNKEITTFKDESVTDVQNSNNEQTTMVADIIPDIQEDIQGSTVNLNTDNFDQTTVSEDIELTSQTTNQPTENYVFSENFASDILNTIGMIDEDLLAEKFNYTMEDEMDNEDISDNGDFDLLEESTTAINDSPTTKTNNEQTTTNNLYEEAIENEIIKKLQETLEERLYPKTERVDIEGTLYTTDSSFETTTDSVTTELVPIDKFDVSTDRDLEAATQGVLSSTEEVLKDLSFNEKVETTTETETKDHTVTTLYFETSTEFANTVADIKGSEATDETNLNQDQISTTESATGLYPKDEEVFIKLGETTIPPTTTTTSIQFENDINTQPSIINVIPSKKHAALKIDDRTSAINKPSQHFRPHQTEQKVFYVNTVKPSLKMPPSINTLKIKVSNSNRRPLPVKLDPAPKQALGLEQSTVDSNADVLEFAKLCNELAFTFWKSLTSEGISSARSLVISPFALTSMLAMIFLGARGSTSGEMNEMLRLDDMVTFNPHLIFRNITDSVENTKEGGIATSAFVRELFSDRAKGKILSFYKDKAQQFYSGHVEEVNFNVINDIIRRRTNLLVKRHTWGKITEYIKTNNVWLNPPLAGLSANIFQTDCSKATVNERDGEMFFQVLPAIRQRRLVPIPAAVYKAGSGFMAGYDPEIDATAVAFGGTDVVSTIFVMPGQQGSDIIIFLVN